MKPFLAVTLWTNKLVIVLGFVVVNVVVVAVIVDDEQHMTTIAVDDLRLTPEQVRAVLA